MNSLDILTSYLISLFYVNTFKSFLIFYPLNIKDLRFNYIASYLYLELRIIIQIYLFYSKVALS